MKKKMFKMDDVIHCLIEREWCNKKLCHFVLFLAEIEAIQHIDGVKMLENPNELIAEFEKGHNYPISATIF